MGSAYIIKLVIGFLMKQIKDLGSKIDWAKLHADCKAQAAAVLPDFLESLILPMIDDAISCLQASLTDAADIELVLKALAVSDWHGALLALQAILAKAAHPSASKLVDACKQLAA